MRTGGGGPYHRDMYRRILPYLLLLGLPVHGAGDAALDRGTLRGLKAASVVIDKIDPQLEQEGLTVDGLQRRVEQRLRSAGFTIDPAAVEFVGLRILATHPTKKVPYGICVMIGLYQPVTLNRDKNIRTATQTWEAGTVLVAQPKLLIPSTNDATDRVADQLAAAWHSVNP